MISNSDSSHSGSQPASMVESPSVGQDRDELERMRQQLYQAGQTRQQMGRKLPSASDLENASLKKHLGGQKEEIARLKVCKNQWGHNKFKSLILLRKGITASYIISMSITELQLT